MFKQLKKDLPIYINGFVVTYLFIKTKQDPNDWIMFILAIISFLWYGENQKNLK